MIRRRALPFLAGLFLLLGAPAVLHAQKLQAGTWTGTAISPDGQAFDVTYTVRMAGDTTKISVDAGEHGVFEFQDVKVLADRVTFHFTPGPTVNCTLMLQEDASYKGDCVDDSGGTAIMHMVPPRKNGAVPESERRRASSP